MSIFYTVLSVSAISTVLSLLIVLADRIFNNYGQCKIDINGGTKTVSVTGGSSLLTALASQKIFIPSACGGKATCGVCKVQVDSDVGPVLPTEEPFLSHEERSAGVRLSCQVKVKGDLRITIPESLFSIQEYEATIERITPMTHDIKEFRFLLPEPIRFKAGQYMQLETKPYGKIRESVSRAYSISSLPSDAQALELIVRLVPDGVCTTYLHDVVEAGEQVTLRGPFGDFYLRQGADELIFIAGGSGLAPIKALVFDILENKLDKQMTFFFGAVSSKDLYYVELFRQLEQEHANFRYIPALSQPTSEDNWDGEVGLITDVVRRHVTDGDNKQAYLCGSPGMINACIEVLTSIGLSEEEIFYDKFS